MTLLGFLSLVLLLAAEVWAVLITAWASEWRVRTLAVLLGLVALAHLLPLVSQVEVWGLTGVGSVGTWTDLGYAAIAFLATALLDRIQRRNRQLEQRLGGHIAYLGDLFENTGEAMLLVDGAGRVIRGNRSFHGLFGFRPGEMEGADPNDLLVPDDMKSDARRLVQRIIAGEQVTRTTVRLRRDGTPVDVSILAGPVKLPESPARAFMLFRDITRQMEVEGTFRHFEKALEQTQVGVTITDLAGKIIFTNPADAEMHGYSPEELIGKDVRIFAPGDLARPLPPDELRRIARWGRETLNVRRDGSVFPVQLLSDLVRNAAGEAIGVVTTCQDISQRKLVEKRLRESEERYALAMHGTSDGLWDLNLENNEVFYSGLWKGMLGYQEGDVGSSLKEWLDRVHPEDRERVENALRNHKEGITDRVEVEHRVRKKDGTYGWFLARGIAERGPDGDPYRIAGALTDIDKRKEYEDRLRSDALYDVLTGIPNRRYFLDQLERTFQQRKRRGDFKFAVVFMDLDRFKEVNTALTHAGGDQMLRAVAERLNETIRPGDVLARLAGDEFCLLINDIQESTDATRIARRIQRAFREPITIMGRELDISMSMGIAVSSPDASDPETLLRNADTAMFRAKARGNAGIEVFDRTMHEQAMVRLRLEEDLQAALDREEFHLLYQPVVELGSERIVGVEALLRWSHPERGEIAPDDFVPLAEETGIIVGIGEWAMRQACIQLQEWRESVPDLEDMSVSVNVSFQQIRQPDFLTRMRTLLDDVGAHPGDLQLEISERIMMMDGDRNSRLIGDLRGAGVKVQLDDFGTGPMALTYLTTLRVDSIKIDQEFISSMGFPEGREGMVESMITLARDLGMRTIAEGVETAEQARRLSDLRCECAQGFLFYRPLPPDQVESLLVRTREVEA